MKTWLKGGLIGGILFLVWYFLIIRLLSFMGNWIAIFSPFSSILGIILFTTAFFGTKETGLFGELLIKNPYWFYLGVFLDFLLWFGIGALIGLIVGKIKSKNKIKETKVKGSVN